MNGHIPHLRVVVTVSGFVMLGFLGVSIYVLGWSHDEVTKGNVIGTWINFAMMSIGFWLGSSSGGKSQSGQPAPVEVTNPPDKPVPIDLPEPTFGRDTP